MRRRLLIVIAASVVVGPAPARAQGAAPPVLTLSLEQALQYALDHYPTVRAALEQVEALTATAAVARTAYLPRFDSVWQTNRATVNNIAGQLLPQSVVPSLSGPVLPDGAGRNVWGSVVGALFSWEPFDLGLRDAMIREAEAGAVRARADRQLTQLAVQQAVGAAFLNVVNAEQGVAVAGADVERREVLARAAHTLADNQLRAGAEASRADAELAAARTQALRVRQTLDVARTSLAQVLGIGDGTVSVSAVRLFENEAAVALARAREGVLEKTDRPKVYLQSSVFARGSGANPDGSFEGGFDGLGLERANWAARVQVVFPNLFDFASLRARRAAAGALARAESARYDEAVLLVTSQRRTADAVVDAARAIARNTPVQLAAAQQTEAQARARYEAGLASIVEIAEAQNLLAGAEYQNAVARVDVWRALLAQAIAEGNLRSFIDVVRGSGAP